MIFICSQNVIEMKYQNVLPFFQLHASNPWISQLLVTNTYVLEKYTHKVYQIKISMNYINEKVFYRNTIVPPPKNIYYVLIFIYNICNNNIKVLYICFI